MFVRLGLIQFTRETPLIRIALSVLTLPFGKKTVVCALGLTLRHAILKKQYHTLYTRDYNLPSDTSMMQHNAPQQGRMPTIYIPHGGGPCFFMNWDPPDNWNSMKRFLEQLASTLPRKPSSILLISAHWNDAREFTVGTGEKPELIYDYYGFPDHTYQLKYPAPGNPALAHRVKELISQSGNTVFLFFGLGTSHKLI